MSAPDVVTAGEALVAFLPDSPAQFEDAQRFRAHVGGAELNFAVCLATLGHAVAWHGHLGDDPTGRIVLSHLRRSGVDVTAVRTWPDERTGIYLRDWQPDGERRPVYHRTGSAARRLHPAMLPPTLQPARWLHLTGITAALGEGPRELLHALIDRAHAHDARVSFDPNYRPALWLPDVARRHLREIAARCDVLLLSEEDAELLFGADDAAALDAAASLGPSLIVLKRGRRGALAREAGRTIEVPAESTTAVDPVGAGDAFDAGLVSALLRDAPLEEALLEGARLGARATEQPGEHPPPSGLVVPAA